MCSISVNSTVDQQLNDLERSDDKIMVEDRLFTFANEANIGIPGALDNPSNHMKRMPSDLKGIRKIRIGRHRIYFTGHCNQCSYRTFYIKKFKTSGKNDEDTKKFQERLRRILQEPSTREITNTNNVIENS